MKKGVVANSLIIHKKRAFELQFEGDVWFDSETVVLNCTYGYFKVMHF